MCDVLGTRLPLRDNAVTRLRVPGTLSRRTRWKGVPRIPAEPPTFGKPAERHTRTEYAIEGGRTSGGNAVIAYVAGFRGPPLVVSRAHRRVR